MARTRAKDLSKGAEAAATGTDNTTNSLEPSDTNPPKLFILPKNSSNDARIVTLPNPATSSSNRYYYCPVHGLYEFVKIAAPRTSPRSLLFTTQRKRKAEDKESGSLDTKNDTENGNIEIVDSASTEQGSISFSTGYISRSADLFVATPVDPMFFLLPILSPALSPGQKKMFLTFDDHLDSVSGPIQRLFQTPATKALFENRLHAICDIVDAGDESMFRISINKLTEEIIRKAKNMIESGLPESIEHRFVRQALQGPVLSIKNEGDNKSNPDAAAENSQPPPKDSQTTVVEEPSQTSAPSDASKETQSSVLSQTSATTDMTSISVATDSTALAPQSAGAHTKPIERLLRFRTAINFMLSSYVPPHLRVQINKGIESSNSVNFTPLDEHMNKLESLREEARALRSLSDNISRKRAFDDEEAVEARAEKKRKKDEEEKKKKMESRAAKELKKVDTSGMKKLSSFFTKAPKK